ncbi:MAG: hypothetical protein IPL23_31365 [Saprospiraceae bacterium]|nr:hypothetical protein [Saprospiraceae bacterium]
MYEELKRQVLQVDIYKLMNLQLKVLDSDKPGSTLKDISGFITVLKEDLFYLITERAEVCTVPSIGKL